MEIKLEEINGFEILEFLNKEIEDNDELCDISLSGPFIFESQSIDDNNHYTLSFTAYINNWGELQPIEGNEIVIHNSGNLSILVGEAFEGDGSDDKLENVLIPWLTTHKFKKNIEEDFQRIMTDVNEKLPQIDFTNINGMQNIIYKLIQAKSYMK